ncbi:unnamed protein product [Linum trigynum]|uniref:WRC domain-containing protein n=1 Tax=Linum trigynum TaxID=586398 RepID=A0AAV2DC36_9ROSI
MRIRKRKVPLPFHLVSPVPIPPSFFSTDPDPTATTATPPPPLVQLRQDPSGTGAPIPASDDNKAGAAGFGSNPTDRLNRAERNGHVGSDGIGWAHPIYPISWEDGKDEFGIKRSIRANNVAAASIHSKGSKCSSSTDPEILGQQQRQSAAPASSSASTSHLPPVLGAMSTWCKEYPHLKDTKNDNSHNNKSPLLIPSRKRSSWSSSPSSSSSSSSYFDINGDPATIRSPSNGQQEVRPQAYQTPRDTKVVHADHISGIGGGANSNNDKKKRTPAGGGGGRGGGGGVVMEGSRCSRVNGRGWRCSQPTLVGYSLCEHHLGKGRLRSITTASNLRPPPRQLGTIGTTSTTMTAANPSLVAPKTKPNPSLTMITSPVVHPFYDGTDTRTKGVGVVLPSSSYGLYDEVEEEEEKRKPQPQFVFPSNKKKSKLGTVKARSISSLLDQPDNSNAAVAALLADNHHHHNIKY